MKTRTRVVAWVYVAASAIGVMGDVTTVTSILIRGQVWSFLFIFNPLLKLAISTSLLIGWLALLRRSKWAWSMLFITYVVSMLRSIYFLAVEPELISSRWMILIAGPVLFTVIPLLILLTDRPGGWNVSHEER